MLSHLTAFDHFLLVLGIFEFIGGIGFFVWCLCKVASDADDAAEADYAAALRGEIE